MCRKLMYTGSAVQAEPDEVVWPIRFCDAEEMPLLKDIHKLIGKQIPAAGGNPFETAQVKQAVAEKNKAIKEESKRRNMFGSKRDGSYWRNKKRAEGSNANTAPKKK